MVWIRVLGAAALIAVSGAARAQSSLDAPEAMAIADAQLRLAAEPRAFAAPIGSMLSWSNPMSGSRGTIVPVSEGETEYGLCRDLEETVIGAGRITHGVTTGCRQGDGSWKAIRTTLSTSPYAADVPADLPGGTPQPLPQVLLKEHRPTTRTTTTTTTP